jgi:hypothetical protein
MTNIKNDFNIGMVIEILLKMVYQSLGSNTSRSYFETSYH